MEFDEFIMPKTCEKKVDFFLQFIREIKLATDREAPCRCNLTSFLCQDFGAVHPVFTIAEMPFQIVFFQRQK